MLETYRNRLFKFYNFTTLEELIETFQTLVTNKSKRHLQEVNENV